jgi:hypothetical protein
MLIAYLEKKIIEAHMLVRIFDFKLATMDMPICPSTCARQVSAFYFPCQHDTAGGVWHGDVTVI